jgi:hypothetical protein
MCGNGVIDGNELCDGSSFRSDVSSCGQALMGSYYYGSLRCTSNCTIDTSGCYQQGDGGAPSFGGGPNGGVFGQGAMGGIFGFPNTPANDCYANGGVPDPASGNCLFGAAATNVCFSLPGGSSCVAKCGCSYCANLYAHCESDGACPWILSCAGQAKCSSLAVCMQAGCANIVDSAGGPKTVSASLADQVLSCFASNGCPPGC